LQNQHLKKKKIIIAIQDRFYKEEKMSHYATLQTEFRYRNCLIKALEDVYGVGNVEIYENDDPARLYGYQGDLRPEIANIIVRRKFVGRAANDLGFMYDRKTKTYKTIISEYDIKRNNKLPEITKRYINHVIETKFPKNKYRILSKDKNEIVLQVIGD